jgi:hypothetical protein
MTVRPLHSPEWLRAGHIEIWLLLEEMRYQIEKNEDWKGKEHQQALLSALMEEYLTLEREDLSKELIHLLDNSLRSLSMTDTKLIGLKRFLQRERRRALTILQKDESTDPELPSV